MPLRIVDQRDALAGLRTIEAGAFYLLQMIAWDMPGCILPDDDHELARITRLDIRTWRRMRDQVLARFDQAPCGGWTLRTQVERREFVEAKLGLNEPASLQQDCRAESNDLNQLPEPKSKTQESESDQVILDADLKESLAPTFQAAGQSIARVEPIVVELVRSYGPERMARVARSMKAQLVRHPLAYLRAALQQDQRERPNIAPDPVPSRYDGPPIEVMRMEAGSIMADGSPARARRLVDQLGADTLVHLVRRLDRGDDARSWFLRVERAALAMPVMVRSS